MLRATMIMMFPYQTAVGTVRRIRVSLPLIPDLVDNTKYFRPDDVPALTRGERRAWSQPKVSKIVRPVKPAAPHRLLGNPP